MRMRYIATWELAGFHGKWPITKNCKKIKIFGVCHRSPGDSRDKKLWHKTGPHKGQDHGTMQYHVPMYWEAEESHLDKSWKMGITRNRPTLEDYHRGAKFWGDQEKSVLNVVLWGVLPGIENRKNVSKSLDQSDRLKVAIQRWDRVLDQVWGDTPSERYVVECSYSGQM